jgi:hypothetical protein
VLEQIHPCVAKMGSIKRNSSSKMTLTLNADFQVFSLFYVEGQSTAILPAFSFISGKK